MADAYTLHMPHWPKFMGGEPPGTPSERARMLLAKLGHPELRLPPVVHVGGTKGKGSTIAFLRAILEAAGYKVHSYTSPHLAKFNERIVLAGDEINDGYLHEILEKTRKAAGDMPVGFFDATTAAAMLAFASRSADILLMEMGLGGVVDATNVIDNPLLTILTTISYDHMEYMGETLPEIAAFEAGLFKPHVPSVVSFQHETVWPVLTEKATLLGTQLYAYGAHWQVRRHEKGMSFADAHGEVVIPPPLLSGMHQIVNAGNAIAALSVMEDFNVSPDHIIYGLTHAKWKGRLEQLSPFMIPEGSELWFDGGHNMASGQAIGLYANEFWQDKPLYMIFGTSQGKDIASIIAPFKDQLAGLYAVSVKSEPKSYSPEAIQATTIGMIPTEMADGIGDALRAIMARETQPFRVLVFGSLYLWLEAVSV